MLLTSLKIKEPGLNVLPPGVERYVVNGGGLTGIQIFADDEIEIINNEGNQICEICVFNSSGKPELGIFNLKESKNGRMGNRVPARRRHLPNCGPGFRLGQRERACAAQLSQDVFDGCPALLVDQKLKRTRINGTKLNNTMVAVEEMTNARIRELIEELERVIANRKDLYFRDVRDKQIISALLCELSLRFAEGYLYKLLQEVANKARRRGLLSNPIHNQSYSTAVGNTERMKPSAMGWAQTQGILVRELHDARRYLRQLLESRIRRPHGAQQQAVAAVAGVGLSR